MERSHTAWPGELLALLPAPLLPQCQPLPVRRGEQLFQTGRRPVWMYFVVHGEVVLERSGADAEVAVLQRTRHGFVGEASLQSERYHCDAVAVADTLTVRIPCQALREALAGDGEFAMRWIRMLNQEVKRLRQQCERLGLKTVQARLLHLVRTEGGAAGLPLQAGLKTWAPELGVTHEALYRCVASLERQGLLARSDGRLRLLVGLGPASHPGRP